MGWGAWAGTGFLCGLHGEALPALGRAFLDGSREACEMPPWHRRCRSPDRAETPLPCPAPLSSVSGFFYRSHAVASGRKAAAARPKAGRRSHSRRPAFGSTGRCLPAPPRCETRQGGDALSALRQTFPWGGVAHFLPDRPSEPPAKPSRRDRLRAKGGLLPRFRPPHVRPG